MAELSELFGSDEEILKAMCIADDLAKEFRTNSTKDNLNDENSTHLFDSVFLESELAPASVNDLSEDSGCPKISTFNKISRNTSGNSLQVGSEYQLLSENICCLEVMNDLCIERVETIKRNNDEMMRTVLENDKKILSSQILNERFEMINKVIMHVQTVANEAGRIKQFIRSRPLKNSLKIHPSCQRSVVHFFHLATELMESLEKDKECIEKWNENKNNEPVPTSKELHHLICEILTEVRITIDNLNDFRKNVASLTGAELVKETETGGELANETENSVELVKETETGVELAEETGNGVELVKETDLECESSSLSSMEIDHSITESSYILTL